MGIELDRHRRELTGYCHRILGSSSEAEDAAQETLIRAWRNLDTFEGRSILRTWLYRIATNVCLDMLSHWHRRPQSVPSATPDRLVASPSNDPVERALNQESIRLAFAAALQHLPPRQRAVLILRDVLRWTATEVAELLGTTTVAVNSALQRARTAVTANADPDAAPAEPDDPTDRARLDRYVDAFQRLDVATLTALLHDDASVAAARG